MKPSTLLLLIGTVMFSWCPTIEAASRKKRYLFINPEAPITLGFLLNMPISLALPTLAQVNTGRSFTLDRINMVDQEIPEELYWDPAYEQQLEKLAIYFAHLQLPVLSCQERLLCELASEPDSYSPIGEIFMKELRQLHGPVKTSLDSLMWRYMSAAREGFTSPIEQCESAYPMCPIPAEKMLNIPVLRVWQYISSKLNLKLI